MLSWDDFRYVKAIAETGSLATAADQLGVNHSTVFRRLQQVEERLGARLFERHRGGYVATAAGEEAVRLADRMSEDVVTFERRITGRDLRPSGELRVTTNDTLLVHLLPPVLASFRRKYPEIVVDMVVSNQALNLSKRDADVALRVSSAPPDTLVGRRIGEIGWAVYGPGAFSGKPFDVHGPHPWVGFGDPLSGIEAAKWLAREVGPQRVVFRVDTVLGLAEAIAAGVGVGLLPCFIAAVTPGLVRLMPVDPTVTGTLWLLTHPDLRATARVRAFMDHVGAALTDQRALIEGRDDPTPRIAPR